MFRRSTRTATTTTAAPPEWEVAPVAVDFWAYDVGRVVGVPSRVSLDDLLERAEEAR